MQETINLIGSFELHCKTGINYDECDYIVKRLNANGFGIVNLGEFNNFKARMEDDGK